MLTASGTGEHPRKVGGRPAGRGRALAALLAGVVGLGLLGAPRDRAGAQPAPADEAPARRLTLPPTPGRSLQRPLPARDLTVSKSSAQQAPAPANAGNALPLPAPPPPENVVPPAAAPLLPGIPHPEMLPLKPAPHISAQTGRYIRSTEEPDSTLEIIVGRLQIFNLQQPPRRVQVGDDSVCNYALLSPTELSIQGVRVGTTVLNLWFADAPDPGRGRLVSLLVRVLPDPDARYRLERAYKNLENEINRAFPNSRVQLGLVGDKLVVSGQARDVAEANMIMRMVQANVLPETADSPDLNRSSSADPATVGYNRYLPAFHRQVVNMMRVPGEQQVVLQVQVVEVDRAAARSIGLNFAAFRRGGSWFVAGTTGNLAQTRFGGGLGGFVPFATGLGLTGLGGLPNLPVALDHGQIQLAILALRSLSYARYLAEPNLVTLNGQTAQFQVGGLFPVPVVTGVSAAGLQGVNFIPTGVQLAFTPFLTDRDRVRLSISAEVSDRDLNVVPTLIDGAAIPSLVTRNFQTTVELRDGQTLAVAGLIESKLDADSTRVPGLGCIPIINRIAGYDRIGNREKELVILVTPRLVRPFDCGDPVPPPPGLDLLEPTDWEFYVLGRIESHTGTDYRSPIRTDCDRNKQFRAMENEFLVGPSGPAIDLPDAVTDAGGKGPAPNAPTSLPPPPPGAAGQPNVLDHPGGAGLHDVPSPYNPVPMGPPTSIFHPAPRPDAGSDYGPKTTTSTNR